MHPPKKFCSNFLRPVRAPGRNWSGRFQANFPTRARGRAPGRGGTLEARARGPGDSRPAALEPRRGRAGHGPAWAAQGAPSGLAAARPGAEANLAGRHPGAGVRGESLAASCAATRGEGEGRRARARAGRRAPWVPGAPRRLLRACRAAGRCFPSCCPSCGRACQAWACTWARASLSLQPPTPRAGLALRPV